MAKKVKLKACDFTLLLATLLLVFIGIVMVFSSSWPEAIRMNDGYFFFETTDYCVWIGFFRNVVFHEF